MPKKKKTVVRFSIVPDVDGTGKLVPDTEFPQRKGKTINSFESTQRCKSSSLNLDFEEEEDDEDGVFSDAETASEISDVLEELCGEISKTKDTAELDTRDRISDKDRSYLIDVTNRLVNNQHEKGEEDLDLYIRRTYPIQPIESWDVETILTTRINTLHIPGTIARPTKESVLRGTIPIPETTAAAITPCKPPVQVSPIKSEISFGINYNEVDRKQNLKDIENYNKEIKISETHVINLRVRGESNEEKRNRKKVVKAHQKETRFLRKQRKEKEHYNTQDPFKNVSILGL